MNNQIFDMMKHRESDCYLCFLWILLNYSRRRVGKKRKIREICQICDENVNFPVFVFVVHYLFSTHKEEIQMLIINLCKD